MYTKKTVENRMEERKKNTCAHEELKGNETQKMRTLQSRNLKFLLLWMWRYSKTSVKKNNRDTSEATFFAQELRKETDR